MAEKRLTLRLPANLHAKLKRLTDREKRSLNGQIVYLLRQAVKQREEGDGK